MNLRPGMITFNRPRDAMGQFSGGETAGTSADMAAAYGPPESRPAAWGKLGATAALGVGGAAAFRLAKVLKIRRR